MEVTAAAGTGGEWAERTYEAMAPVYDDFTAHHDYEGWLADLLKALERHGLQGQAPARRRLRDRQELHADAAAGLGGDRLRHLAGDARAGPREGRRRGRGSRSPTCSSCRASASSTWSGRSTTRSTTCSARRNWSRRWRGCGPTWRPTGLLLFDVNELLAYRTFFAETEVVERGGRRLVWRGLAATDVAPGSICESRLEVLSEDGERTGEAHTHRQRHFPEAEVLAALEGAGLECLDVYGIYTDGILKQPLDDTIHTKAIYIARGAA